MTRGGTEVSLSPWGLKAICIHLSFLGNFMEERTQTLMALLDAGAQALSYLSFLGEEGS